MFKNKTIFISALDWGLGHATRCVPIIRQLQTNNTVIIGTTPLTHLIFDEEFPELHKIDIVPYNIKYSNKISIIAKLLLNAPRLLKVIKTEHQQLAEIIKKHKVDVVISDNRLGLYNTKIESIYITHQVNLQAGILSKVGNFIHHSYIKKFNQLWIPDFEDPQFALAGKLSAKGKLENVKYIGPLSRLSSSENTNTHFEYLFLLSGPEPYRTDLENALLKIASKSTKPICLVRGTTNNLTTKIPANIKVFDLPKASVLSELIVNSETIICRSGYSTLMDLNKLNKKKLILIPTPTQTEQEYLGKYWQEKFLAQYLNQTEINAKLTI